MISQIGASLGAKMSKEIGNILANMTGLFDESFK
jgi:hypothetical protein